MPDRMDRSRRRRSSAILNEDVRRYHRWCTPSILPDAGARRGLLRLRRLDLGRLLRHAGRPHRRLRARPSASPPPPRAPTARCSRSTARAARTGSCCGCSRSSTPTRSCSSRATSITRSSTRIKAFGLDFRFLPDALRRRASRRVLPPSVDDVLERARRATPRRWPSSTPRRPTRAWRRTRARHRRARSTRASPDALVFVDEAWGGHLHFHPDLPCSAMAAGADICVQSTHKLAGGLQQTGLIHWRDAARRLRADGGGLPRVRHDLAELPPAGVGRRRRARAGRATARPSCWARRSSAREGSRRRCARALPDLDHLDDPRWLRGRRAQRRAAPTWSRRRSGCRATTLSRLRRSPRRSSSAAIVIEKAGVQTITLHHHVPARPTTRCPRRSPRSTDVLAGHLLPGRAPRAAPGNPFAGIDDRPVMHPYARAPLREVDRPRGPAARGDRQGRGRGGRGLPARDPADPGGLPRQRRRRRLPRARRATSGGSIVARDTSLATLRVL